VERKSLKTEMPYIWSKNKTKKDKEKEERNRIIKTKGEEVSRTSISQY
jgi:hypothetical protein